MDLCVYFCITRRALEERSDDLTSRVSGLTGDLIAQIGSDYRRFFAIRTERDATAQELSYVNTELEGHRREHGC
jgi:hypothetical protein